MVEPLKTEWVKEGTARNEKGRPRNLLAAPNHKKKWSAGQHDLTERVFACN